MFVLPWQLGKKTVDFKLTDVVAFFELLCPKYAIDLKDPILLQGKQCLELFKGEDQLALLVDRVKK